MKPLNIQSVDIKAQNRNLIYQALWQHKRLSKQDLVNMLGLSLPTVTNNLQDLCQEGLVKENGRFNKTGGRSAKGFAVVPTARYAIGVDINKTHISVVAASLYGEIVQSVHHHIHYEKTTDYYKLVGALTTETISKLNISKNEILGVGISVQGLLSPDRKQVTYGPVLNNAGETVEDIAQFIPYECELFHDADAAAFAELWVSPEIINAVYISLSTNLGGALIINREIFQGNSFTAGKLEHVTLFPEGKSCYCGKKGCAEAYCSIHSLTDGIGDEKIETFFELLENDNSQALSRWLTFLNNLTVLTDSLFMLFDCDVILGGYLAPYINRYLPQIKNTANAKCKILPRDYILSGRFKNEAVAAGAALHYVDSFIKNI